LKEEERESTQSKRPCDSNSSRLNCLILCIRPTPLAVTSCYIISAGYWYL
jgi:hypothetical protein